MAEADSQTVQPEGGADPLRLVGSVLDGRYLVEAYVSGGGMGEVYRAQQISLKRPVAIKILRAELMQVPGNEDRFAREALTLSRIDHPNIVRVIDFASKRGGLTYLVMEFAEGPTLESYLGVNSLDPERAVAILAQLCDALGAAHAVGVIHRDLKPDNVILTGSDLGVPKILDFGIARIGAGSSKATQGGLVLGTPEYLSPEQGLGRNVDHRTDLYSLAVMAYRVVAGRLPFWSEDVTQVVAMQVSVAPPPIARVSPVGSSHPALCDVVIRGMAKSPAARFQSAADFKEALFAAIAADRARAAGIDEPPGGDLPAEPVTAELPRVPAQMSGPVPAARSKAQMLAIMLTGVVGFRENSTRQSREETSRQLAILDALVSPVVKAFHGRKVRRAADQVLAVFQSPTDCVLCGQALQDRLWLCRRSAAPTDQFDLRVTITLGEVLIEGSEVIGDAAAIVSSIDQMAEGGQVLMTESVFFAMNKAEVPAQEMGAFTVAGIPEPIRVFRSIADDSGLRPPYSGAALVKLGTLPDPIDQVDGRVVRAPKMSGELFVKRHSRLLAVLGALLVVGLVGAAVARWAVDPATKAAKLLEERQASAALAELGKIPDDNRPKVRLLRGKALHALGLYEKSFAELAAALARDPALMDGGVLRALVEQLDSDHMPDERRAAVAKILVERADARSEKQVRVLLKSGRSQSRRGALEVLEKVGKATPDDRFLVAKDDLEDSVVPCATRQAAVQRLATLADERSIKLLEDWSEDRKCVGREAREAVKKLRPGKAEDGPSGGGGR